MNNKNLSRKLIIFGEQMFANMENAERNKQGGKNVYGVVEMPQQHRDSADGAANKEKITQWFLVPKNISH